MNNGDSLPGIADYEPLIGAGMVERILKKARKFRDLKTVNINSTYYGGGVATLLSSMTLLMNSLGIRSEWRVIQGAPDFFTVTKKFHNALQGGKTALTRRKKEVYEEVIYENAVRNHLDDYDIVVVHDPHPLPLIRHYHRRGTAWLWRCHVDLTKPQAEVWKYLKGYIEDYDAVILSLKEYRQRIKTPQLFFMPALDPFTTKNRDMSKKQIDERLRKHKIPRDLPLVVQVSRFDNWKDPRGVIEAFELASKEIDARLVLVGTAATDDPEGQSVYENLLQKQSDRIIINAQGDDTAFVNAIQRSSDVIMQKSVREGFGLTVAEAMWKGTPVIGGNVGGIRHQIEDGRNGYLVSSVKEAAARIVHLVRNKGKRKRMGERARESVTRKFLLTRYAEEYLNLFENIETVRKIRSRSRISLSFQPERKSVK